MCKTEGLSAVRSPHKAVRLSQAATVVATEVVSSVLLLFPAAQGSLTLLLHTYGNRLKVGHLPLTSPTASQRPGRRKRCPVQELGWEMPEGADYLLALALLAGLNGLGRVSDHAPSQQEIEVVGNAVSNAERYYKLVSSEAERMSAAFVLTAEAWVEQRVVSPPPPPKKITHAVQGPSRPSKLRGTVTEPAERGHRVGGPGLPGDPVPGRAVVVDARPGHPNGSRPPQLRSGLCGHVPSVGPGQERMSRHMTTSHSASVSL